jgi:Kef-type K+ transport system membrane component KefB/Trk K+ transport system NAD-binding subunit
MEGERSFLPLLLVVLLAFVVPLGLSRLKRLSLPVVVGEILAGIVIGRSGFRLIQGQDPALELLAEFGFVFLMFLSGMEIDFSALGLMGTAKPAAGRSWGAVPLGVISFVLTLVLAAAFSFFLWRLQLVGNPWMMALILSTTSLGVVMPVLKERGLIRTPFGQSVLMAALVADFVTMLLITVVVAVLSSGLTFDILLIALLFVAFFLMYHAGRLFFNRIAVVRQTMQELSHASTQIKVRAAFTMMLIFIVLSETLGTEVILGAFLAGAVMSMLRTPDDADLAHKLEAIGFGFFIPIFFIMVGVDFNLAALADSPDALLLVPLLLLGAVMAKFIPVLVFRLSFSWRETLAAAALLSARLSLIIAASAVGLRIGAISESVNAAIVLVAIIAVTLAPLIFVRLLPAGSQRSRRRTLVAGAGDVGLRVAEQLRAHGDNVMIVDPEGAQVVRARQHGFAADLLQLDGAHIVMSSNGERIGAVVATFADSDLNFQVCQWARTAGIEQVVAQVHQPADLDRFEQIGVRTMNPAIDRVALLVLLVRNPSTYNLLTRTDDNKRVDEIVVSDGEWTGKRLRQVRLPGDVLVVALRRHDELLLPHGNTQLQAGDRLTLAGSTDAVALAREMFLNEAMIQDQPLDEIPGKPI